MAQLPSLSHDQKPPMSSEAFKVLATSLLDKKDAAMMKYLSLDFEAGIPVSDAEEVVSKPKVTVRKGCGCTFIDNWREWERTLRLNLAKHREGNLHRSVVPVDVYGAAETPVIPADAYNTAAAVITQEGSPLEGEILLDKARWNAIDTLAGNNYFDRNNVYAYYLKLLLLERHQIFNVEKGFSEYKSLYAQIINSPHNYEENSQGEEPK